jgi:hypothetical protein
MPTPKSSIGPVHDSGRKVRDIVNSLTGKKAPPVNVPDRTLGPKPTLKERGVLAKNKRTIQTNANRQKGTYDTYDPLKSILTKQTMARKRKDAKAVTRTTRRISRRKDKS